MAIHLAGKAICITMKQLLLVLVFGVAGFASAQLPDGTVAPDFTLTDYYGTSHHLYSYLDEGKTVFVEIFAAHCPSCWAYHQTDRLKNIYEQYGPDGTDELMVLALEYDPYNDHNAFIGNHEPWVTQGNWLEGTPYPIFNVEDPYRWVFESYEVTFYPVIYKICPDRLTERVFTSQSEASLYAMVEECQANVSVEETPDIATFRFDPLSHSIWIDRYENVLSLEAFDLQGRCVLRTGQLNQNAIGLPDMPDGVYVFRINTTEGRTEKKLVISR
jgi:cytochrome oxidase Cu insertion factor (SCO1/SenC/PrrC family)